MTGKSGKSSGGGWGVGMVSVPWPVGKGVVPHRPRTREAVVVAFGGLFSRVRGVRENVWHFFFF